MFGKTEVPGDLVVTQLMDDAVLVDQALRNCIDNVDAADENDLQIIVAFAHYTIARPVELSGCSKADADHILSGLLDVLMTTAPDRITIFSKASCPPCTACSQGTTRQRLIRTSLAFCLQSLEKGHCRLLSDDDELRLLIYVAEGLQTEVKVFLDTVLKKYRLNWEKRASKLSGPT